MERSPGDPSGVAATFPCVEDLRGGGRQGVGRRILGVEDFRSGGY